MHNERAWLATRPLRIVPDRKDFLFRVGQTAFIAANVAAKRFAWLRHGFVLLERFQDDVEVLEGDLADDGL